MQLRESLHKTKNFFHKTLQNFNSFFFGEYRKLSKTPLFNPFSCSTWSSKALPTDEFYTDFLNGWESDLEKACGRKERLQEPLMGQDAKPGRVTNFQEGVKEEKKPRASCPEKSEEETSQKDVKEGDNELAKKIKELNMVDIGDVEHDLDVEEALHYYSRLRSPVYLDIVDKFFRDMYSEFSKTQTSTSINKSKRKRRSIRF